MSEVLRALGKARIRPPARGVRYAWISLFALCALQAHAQRIVQSYFVPFSENDVHLALNAIDDFQGNIGSELRSTISIVAGTTNTVIYYDHWEDGYEGIATSPTQTTTEVWGDNNPINGIPPGYSEDIVTAGSIITLDNNIDVPRDPAVITFDGRDEFSVTRWVAVSRAMHATDPGEVLAGAAQMYDRGEYGFQFRAPVGINTATNEMFEYATMLVQAGFDSTVVRVDADNDGSIEETVFLDQGETHEVRFVSKGAVINASKPVQCHMITGDIGSNYEMRWFTLFPSRLWDSSYYSPIGSAAQVPSSIYFFNPNTNPINVHFETFTSTGVVSVAANDAEIFIPPQGSGGHYFTTNGQRFISVEAVDAAQSISGNQAYDWGHDLVSGKALTSMSLIPWGPGIGGSPLTDNGNPVWVTAVSNATLYVDFDADPSTGPLTDPTGRQYDFQTNVTAMQTVKIFDNNDNDQTGMRIYTLDDTHFNTAWGQDPDTAAAGNPYLDMGSAILPFPTVPAVKEAVLFIDNNTNGLANPGDSLKFSIFVENIGFADSDNVIVLDSGASNTTYNLNSTTLNGTNVADDVVPPALTEFPLDEAGLNIGSLSVGETSVVEYVVTIDDPFPTNAAGVINGVFVEEETQVFVPVPVSGFDIAKTSVPTNITLPGSNISYTITVESTSTVAQSSVRISDGLPDGTFWVTNSTRVHVPGFFQGSFLDEFTTDEEFSGNDGPLLWEGNWNEVNESDGAGAGDIQVTADGGAPSEVYMLQIQNSLLAAERMANLGSYTNALLAFDYRRESLEDSSDFVAIDASGDGGNTWTELDRFAGAATDVAYISTNYDITAFIASNTMIRFRSSSALSSLDRVWFDNVEIAAQGTGVTNRGGPPPTLVDLYDIDSNDTIIVNFDVTILESITSSQVVNRASVTSVQSTEPRSAAVTNIVNLPQRANIMGQVRNDTDADGDLGDADGGITNVTITLFSDPNGDGDPADGLTLESTVTDSNGEYLFANYLPDDYVILETDPLLFQSTADADGGNMNLIAVTTTSEVDSVGNDFLDTQRADVHGQVRNDTDGDGNLGDPDAPIVGVNVELFSDPNGDGDPADGTSIGSDVTGTNGAFLFTMVNTGSYVLVETDPFNFVSTADSGGTNDNRIAVTMVGGTVSSNHVFLDARSGISFSKVSSPAGIWFPDLEGTYTISIDNTGVVTHTSVEVTDTMSSGITYMADSSFVVFSTLQTNTFRDEFATVSYGNQDGTENWTADWSESDSQGGGASGGAVQISGGQLQMTDGVAGTPAIEREADLTDYASAWLTFDYDTTPDVDSSDAVDVQASTNGVNWDTLDTIEGQVSGSGNYNLTSHISPNTRIRFIISSLYGGANEFFLVDNVEIRGEEVVSSTTTGAPPPDMLSGLTLSPGGFIRITFTGTVDATSTAVTNLACVTTDQLSTQLCAEVVNTVDPSATPDRIGGQVRNDFDGDGDLLDSDPGVPGVNIELFTDPNGDGDPADGTLVTNRSTDVQGFYLFGQLNAGDYVVVETDLPAWTSTADSDGGNDNRVAVNLPGGVDSLDNDFLDMTISGLLIEKTVDETITADPGQELTYTIAITNTRTFSQAGIDVTDTLGEGLTYVTESTWVTADSEPIEKSWFDQFGGNVYTNDDGTELWAGPWVEEGDDGQPWSGDVRATSDLGDDRLGIRDDDNSVRRAANLTAYPTATLSFDFRRQGLEGGEYAAVEVRTNGTSWVELDQLGNDGSSSTSDGSYQFTNYNITAFIATNTEIRFKTPSGGMSNGDIIYFDNVKISSMVGGTTATNGESPPEVLSDFSVAAGGVIQITLTAAVGFVDEVINTARVTTPSDTNGLFAAVTSQVGVVAATQAVTGVNGNPNALKIAWTAATDEQGEVVKEYDFLCVDAPGFHPGFHPSLTDEWTRIDTVIDSFGIDTGDVNRASPFELGEAMRFYRAARKDKWKMDKNPRVASKEVYVAKCIELEEGENWVSLLMIPDSNTVAQVFGTNTLPAGSQFSEATRVEWYGATHDAAATNTIWLSSDGVWMNATGGIADHMSIPLHEGFNVVIPEGSNTPGLLVVGRVPMTTGATLGHEHTIQGSGIYNVVSYNLPYRVKLKDSGLRDAGFTGAPPGQQVNPNTSDELRILQKGGGSLASPKIRILMNANDEFVFWQGGPFLQSAEDFALDVDDALIIYTQRSMSNFTWSINLPYPTPTTKMNL